MEDARRFLRFVLPGLAFTLEMILFLWILRPSQVTCFMNTHFTKDVGLGPAVAIFVGSGGLGFFLSSLYHAVYWFPFLDGPRFSRFVIDHRRAIQEARAEGILHLVAQKQRVEQGPERDLTEAEVSAISRLHAWQIITALWHARIGRSPRLEKANPRTGSLASILHGVGTLTVGTALILLLFIALFVVYDSTSWLQTPPVRLLVFLVVWVFLVGVQVSAFRVAANHAQRTIEVILLEDLRMETHSAGYAPVWRVRPPTQGEGAMNLSVRALAITGGVLWGGTVLLCGLANVIWPSYAVAFLQLVASIYPGYHATGSLGSVTVGMLYAILDGAVGGLLVGWLYNRFASR